MLTKESKIKILENFYSLDYVFFGKPIKKVDACCPELVEEYINVKGALLSTLIEMYKLVGHSPAELTEKVDMTTLKDNARRNAQIAREMCEKLVISSKGRQDVKEEVQRAINEDGLTGDVEQLVQEKIREKAFSLAVDNLLIASTISESQEYSNLGDWEGDIISEAYKILRDSLVESALLIVDYDV